MTSRTPISLMLLAFFPLFFGGAGTESFAETTLDFQKALGCFEKGDYQQAEQIYQGIIKQRPDADQALEAQKGLVMVYISLGKQAEAETAYQQLLSNFPHNTHMADVIHHGIACHYRRCKNDDKADELDQYVLSNWPTTESAMWAQVDIVGANINRKDFTAAQVGVNNLFADFAKNEHLCDAIHSLAYHYRQAQETDKANELDQYVVSHRPSSESAMWAQVDIINSNIDGKDYTFAQTGIDNLLTRFSSNEKMANVLHGMAYKYRQAQEAAKADELDLYVLSNWPTTNSAMWSQIDIIKFGIGDMNTSDVWVDVNNLVAVFSGEEELSYAIFQIANSWYWTGKYEDANQLGRKLINGWPDDKYTLWTQLTAVLANIQMNDANAAETAIDNLHRDFAANAKFPDAMLIIAEAYYEKGNRHRDRVFLGKSIELLDGMTKQDISDNMQKANVFYMKGLNYWQLGNYFDAADAFSDSIEAEPKHQFAGNMHWLIADSYEKLKTAGDVNADDANAVIEWGYQTLFDNYPDCSIIDYAAMRLSQINMEQGKQTAACAYYCWLVMNADGDEGRMGFINNMFKRCGRCGK